ncbi:MAG: M20/M25/M40 family metallo-hydrolase [Paramuribaculum sp.]|nr:M20/M25/M40 family metallo-hydrolase [Paramuribaculum sp.]
MNPVRLLQQLIALPSFSRSENATADLLFSEMDSLGFSVRRFRNNIWVLQPSFDPAKPTLLLNSHHDTVRPTDAYTRDPFSPEIIDGRLYGLGSNDAGASVVALMSVFEKFHNRILPFNLLLAITAEEEVTGENGMRAFLPHLERQGIAISMALVGEPTGMQPAVAERGLVVLDCLTSGKSGHAARGEGVNALYRAIEDIEALRNFRFPSESRILGPVGLQVTVIEAGRQHNVVPAECRWVVDVRTTDAYSNEETVDLLSRVVKNSSLTPRSTRVRASVIENSHPMVKAAVMMGGMPFVSPTTSDMSQMAAFPSLKMGPGKSERSHSADEFVEIAEIENAILKYETYINNLSHIFEL